MEAALGISPQESCYCDADSARTRDRRYTLAPASGGGWPAWTEVELPDEMSFRDKGKHLRHDVRLKWWDDSATNWRNLLAPGTPIFDSMDEPVEALPDTPIPSELLKRYTDDIPVIFGHYWFEAPLEVTNPRALCVDYSAGAGGPLAAYRFDGTPPLHADHLVSS